MTHINRRERRAARKRGQAIFVDWGHLLEGDPNFGLPVNCYLCARPHKAFGFARIQSKSRTLEVPLCEEHLHDDDIVRKFLNAPDLKMREGGEATTEQILAIAEKLDETEH